ncbi:hypothetical protein D3C76_1516750 [compost metagenome]
MQQHPQILYRRPVTRVIKINKQWAITPQNIARMAVTVQTPQLPILMPMLFDRLNQLVSRCKKAVTLRFGQQRAARQNLTR